MPPKRPPKKIKKKPSRQKLNFPRLIMVVLASVIILAFLVYSFYSPLVKKKAFIKPVTGELNVPKFKKDGEVTIFKSPSPVVVNVEVADNEEERMQGLMYRYSMNDNDGMFFIFQDEEPRSFWMKNTYIPLDIIYISADKEIVSIQKYTQPKSTESLPSEKPAQYVLEVNAGFSDKYDLQPGDKISFKF